MSLQPCLERKLMRRHQVRPATAREIARKGRDNLLGGRGRRTSGSARRVVWMDEVAAECARVYEAEYREAAEAEKQSIWDDDATMVAPSCCVPPPMPQRQVTSGSPEDDDEHDGCCDASVHDAGGLLGGGDGGDDQDEANGGNGGCFLVDGNMLVMMERRVGRERMASAAGAVGGGATPLFESETCARREAPFCIGRC